MAAPAQDGPQIFIPSDAGSYSGHDAPPVPPLFDSHCVEAGEVCEDVEPCDPPSPAQFYATAGALFLNRNNRTDDQPVVLDNATLNTLRTTHNLGFGTARGLRLLLGARLIDRTSLEASYFGLLHWNSSNDVLRSNRLRIPGDIALATLDFLDADLMHLSYWTQLNSGEINAVQTLLLDDNNRVQGLAGLRYVRVAEQFDILSSDVNTGTSNYTINSRNNLWGVQIGVRSNTTFDRLELSASVKGGAFINACSQHTFLGDFDNSFVFRDLSVKRGRGAVAGELNINLALRLTNVWSIRGGYNLFGVAGVALAPDQLDFTDTPDSSMFVYTRSSALYYGPSFEITACW